MNEVFKKDWTHKEVQLTDIRKLHKLYIISTKDFNPLFVSEKIFEDRLRSYFLCDPAKVSREQIMKLKFNMYITKGYYIKVQEGGEIKKFEIDENKFYVSYLEISGPLATFQSVYKPPKEFKERED